MRGQSDTVSVTSRSKCLSSMTSDLFTLTQFILMSQTNVVPNQRNIPPGRFSTEIMFPGAGRTENQEKHSSCRRAGSRILLMWRGKRGQRTCRQELGSVIYVSYYKTVAAVAATTTNTPPRTQLCCGFLTAHLKTLTASCLLDVSLSEPKTFRTPGSGAPPKEENSFILSSDIVLYIQNAGYQDDLDF